jgi:hypothetical protein
MMIAPGHAAISICLDRVSFPSLTRPSVFAAAFALGLGICPLAASQQIQPRAASIPNSFQLAKTEPPDVTLNKEAKASDAAGIHRYSERLVGLLVPARAGQKYIRSLSDRLATAEQLARAGKANLVPEAKVAQAYNDLMRRIGAPASLYSEEAVVHRMRHDWFVADSNLDSVSAHPNDCNPGEAVYLLVALFWNNGGPHKDPPSTPALGGGTTSSAATGWVSGQPVTDPQAGFVVSSYSAVHSRRANEALFEKVARTLGF